MHTKQQIRQLLESAGTGPRRQFGQNFLIDLNLMRLLLETAGIGPEDVVLEVGCGTGSLTEALAERAGAVIGVEIDNRLIDIARQTVAEKPNAQILHCDVLRNKNAVAEPVIQAVENALSRQRGRFMLVANLPYNIASPLMLNLVSGPVKADQMHVTVQKEVADRMTGAPRTADYGPLTVFLAATGQAQMIRVLKPNVFWPEPKVDSAMVSFRRDSQKACRIADAALFSRIVSLFMGHRRKMVKACTKLASGELAKISDWQTVFEESGVDPTSRPDRITPQQYITMANLCHDRLKAK